MKKSDVFEYMQNNELESARFVVNKGSDNEVVVEVFNDPHIGDLMAVQIWHGNPMGNQCFLSSYGEKTFTVTNDSMSSEMLSHE